MRVLLWIDCQLTIGWSQCGQVKALSTKLQKVKVYASSVHGLNLLFHRFLPTGTEWSARHCAASILASKGPSQRFSGNYVFSARARKQSQRFVEIASCAVVLLRGPCERIHVLFFF